MKIAVEEWELYNHGHLLIKWFDTELDTIEEIEQYVASIKASEGLNSADMELFIADYEANYLYPQGGLSFDSECLLEAYEVAEQMDSLNDTELKQYKAMINAGYKHKEALQSYEDVEIYEDTSMEELAVSTAELK